MMECMCLIICEIEMREGGGRLKVGRSEIQNDLDGLEGTALLGYKNGG